MGGTRVHLRDWTTLVETLLDLPRDSLISPTWLEKHGSGCATAQGCARVWTRD